MQTSESHDTRLTEHFTLAELTRTSVRLPNDPPPMLIPKLLSRNTRRRI